LFVSFVQYNTQLTDTRCQTGDISDMNRGDLGSNSN